jgi:hypothetical protein
MQIPFAPVIRRGIFLEMLLETNHGHGLSGGDRRGMNLQRIKLAAGNVPRPRRHQPNAEAVPYAPRANGIDGNRNTSVPKLALDLSDAQILVVEHGQHSSWVEEARPLETTGYKSPLTAKRA